MTDHPRVVIAGAGLAGLAAAISARELGASVIVIEKGQPEDFGGNAAFSSALFLFSHNGPDDIAGITDRVTESLEAERIAGPPYTVEEYVADLMEMSNGRTDATLAQALAEESLENMRWLVSCGVQFQIGPFGAYVRDGTLHLPPSGQVLHATGAATTGLSLIDPLLAHAHRLGVEIRPGNALEELIVEAGRVHRVSVRQRDGSTETLAADAVVVATGGYQASPAMRKRHLGGTWESVRLRGSRLCDGAGIEAAMAVGADSAGDWSACHSGGIDPGCPPPMRNDDPVAAHLYYFWLGILVNRDGQRFVDEGPGLWIKNYSRMGKAILPQPGREAWQIFDQRAAAFVQGALPALTPVSAPTVRALAEAIGLPPDELERTVEAFNSAAAGNEARFDPDVVDGASTTAISPAKSNWAVPLDQPPYIAYPVTAGITFTLAGLRIDPDGHVLDRNGEPIAGLYGAGEATGGLFYADYPGGSALMRSSVFGRNAGRSAAREAATALSQRV